MKPEIERKYFVKEFPKDFLKKKDVKVISIEKIEQTYLGLGKGDELRVRRITDIKSRKVRFTYTFKKGKSGNKMEEETKISRELYKSLLESRGLRPLVKIRTTVKCDDYVIEIDKYKDFDLVVAEVEFKSMKQMKKFKAPKWCGKDITGVKKYSNKTLWKRTQEEVK